MLSRAKPFPPISRLESTRTGRIAKHFFLTQIGSHTAKGGEVVEKVGLIAIQCSLVCMEQRGQNEAIDLFEKAVEVMKKLLGQEHGEVSSSMSMKGLVYASGGQWDKAEELQIQVMETSKRPLGEEHPETLISMANLALT